MRYFNDMGERTFCVYMLGSGRNGTLYVGITSNLARRVEDHRRNVVPGFTSTYHVHRLVWYEVHESAYAAITREKQLKKWKRAWKVELIEKDNPYWNDLSSTLV